MVSRIVILLSLNAILAGCATFKQADSSGMQASEAERIITDLTPSVEAFYLSWHALDRVYKDIKYLERGLLFEPDDRLLDYVQKSSLYIQDASMRIHQRWEILSVLTYIRPEMMRDYLTLSAAGLKTAQRQIDYDRMFLDIYTPFIAHDAFIQELKRARDHIEACVRLMDQIARQLSPYVHQDPMPAGLTALPPAEMGTSSPCCAG
jgi:hypothetical protein